MLTRRDSEKGVMLGGITFHHPGAFWFGVIATIVGGAMHLPMYLMAKDMGYRLAGMPMDMGMTLGMGAIAVGLMASFWGVYPRAGQGHRLTGTAVYHIVGRLGAEAGLTVRPQELRHLAITTALDMTDGDVRAVAKFSRHKDLRPLSRYRDNRQDLAGKVAALVAEE